MYTDGREDIKPSLFTEDMIVYVEKSVIVIDEQWQKSWN